MGIIRTIKFCKKCGLVLNPEIRDKIDDRYLTESKKFKGTFGPHREFCNNHCAGTYNRYKSPKKNAKHGVTAF